MGKFILKDGNKKNPILWIYWGKKEINGKLDRSISLQTIPVVIII